MGISDSIGELYGHIVTEVGCHGAKGFNRSAEVIIRTTDIQPWQARALIGERLRKQIELSKKCSLRFIPVRDGFNHFCDKIGRFNGLTRQVFLDTAKNLISTKQIKTGADDELLLQVFDSIDYDGNGSLTHGEWAGGLIIFFQGTPDDRTKVLFEMLDRDKNGDLSKSDMKEYLRPLVNAMTPPEASALRPLLLQHAIDQIFNAVDAKNAGKCSFLEFQNWRKDHDLLEELAHMIEAEIYKIWLERKVLATSKTAMMWR